MGNDTSLSSVARPLILVATAPGRSATDGTASIGVDSESPQTYVAGALLVNGAQLTEVHADRVVLRFGGRTESLYLRKEPTFADSLAMVGGPTREIRAPTPATDALSPYLRVSVVYGPSGMAGYEVIPGKHAAVFSQLGLEQGDVITAIEGLPLVDPESAWAALSRLVEGESMTATIRRHNSSKQIRLDGASILKMRESGVPLPPS